MATKNSSQPPPAYALDCEFIQVIEQGNNTPSKSVVSIGIVDNQLELILYSRIRKPKNSTVVDDSFVRTRGGLNRDWNKGIGIHVTQELIRDFVTSGGILIGWQLEGDLGALGFVEAQRRVQDNPDRTLGERTNLPLEGNNATATIVELTDVYRTSGGNKCQLGECYKFIFGRSMNAHNAGDDAKMTMELYNYWIKKGSPASIEVKSLCWHIVNVHSFSEQHRIEILWNILRPIRAERDVVIEDQRQREGKAFTYKLKFRLREELEAYLMIVRTRVDQYIQSNTYPLSWTRTDLDNGKDNGYQVDCQSFKLHLYHYTR